MKKVGKSRGQEGWGGRKIASRKSPQKDVLLNKMELNETRVL